MFTLVLLVDAEQVTHALYGHQGSNNLCIHWRRMKSN